ncbi:uncharacterized protein DNG_03466 [Cephalotrichum gorgonifer]|uniref:BZIP domain-containing protein n=1 Tax=Cephalotrichum gorgonifer TaxID=2041049 RepID=A0AAE8STL7_9PEZI|nr:uncharacterized protein DNG_03466 [Cephalotrichum gorgonifer]
MSSRSSKRESESSSKRHSGSGSSKSKSKSKSQKSDDWAEVSEPEERRRIQNRIAQRKFREKTRETKERAERDARNQQHAASCYQVPSPSDIASEHEVSGLPWGTFSMRHVVSRGHEAASRRSSGRGDYIREDDPRYQSSLQYGDNVAFPPETPFQQQHGSLGGSSTGEDGYYDADPQLFYGSSDQPFLGDQFNSAGWPESPGYGPVLGSMPAAPSHDVDGTYY